MLFLNVQCVNSWCQSNNGKKTLKLNSVIFVREECKQVISSDLSNLSNSTLNLSPLAYKSFILGFTWRPYIMLDDWILIFFYNKSLWSCCRKKQKQLMSKGCSLLFPLNNYEYTVVLFCFVICSQTMPTLSLSCSQSPVFSIRMCHMW